MSKLTMLTGLPASGKSTLAAEIVKSGNYVRVNRDLLRTMLHFDKFSGRNEGITVDTELFMARAYLHKKLNVVVDDCNLNPKNELMWKGIAAECGATFEKINVKTDWLTCCLRDEQREKMVGKHVIKNMALQYGFVIPPTKGFILCDLDGTLCDIEHRRHFVSAEKSMEMGKKDWQSFFDNIPFDKPREHVVKMVIDFYNEGYEVIYITARPEKYRDATLKWLAAHGLGFAFTVIMRRDNDKRQDTDIKQQILDTYFPDKTIIHKVIDDRPSVIRMWKENGLDVIDVGDGVEF